MRTYKPYLFLLALAVAGILAGCSDTSTKAPDIAGNIRTSLNQAGLKGVTVSQDRDKGVVTLGGRVATDNEKLQAESIGRNIAGSEVVANQIAVIPPGAESEARKVESDLDKGIQANLDAVLITEGFHDGVKYSVKNFVVTLTGNVDSEAKRARAEVVAAGVPNVRQVVNELQVKGQKATSSN